MRPGLVGTSWACLLVACAAPPPGRAAQAITNGAADAGDPAVIALVDAQGHAGCTAAVIGTHTAITAAHCLESFDPRTLRAFFGSSLAAGGTFVAISDGQLHPAFDPGTLAHDLALVTLRDAAPVAPLSLEPAALDASLVGTTIRVVGFGTTAAAAGDAEVKRAGTAQVTALAADELTVVPAPSQPCRGDSGGPALLPQGTVAAVVSRGDPACADHATYARIDVARASFVDPYLAATAPGTAAAGDACLYDGQCAGGPCLVAHDDPELAFCSRSCRRDADCPAPMTCAPDGCRYPEPSPGALGAACAGDADCTSHVCLDQVCTRACGAANAACPAGFACGGQVANYCFAEPGGCGGCTAGGSGAGAIAIIAALWGLARARRSARSG